MNACHGDFCHCAKTLILVSKYESLLYRIFLFTITLLDFAKAQGRDAAQSISKTYLHIIWKGGCQYEKDYPGELIVSGLTPFRGIHLFKGEPVKGAVGFIMVQGLETLHKMVKYKGWTQITDIELQPWGARECRITTIDGSILRFFETTWTGFNISS